MLYRLLKTSILPVLFITVVLCPSPALAAGIGVTPGRMEFSVRPGSTEMQTLHVINQSNEEMLFRVYVEGEYGEWFQITPGEFTLGSQETKSVEIGVTPPRTAAESHDVFICVVSLPTGSDLRIGAGVKVAAHVQLLGLPLLTVRWWIVAVIIVVAVGIGLLVWWRRRLRYA